MKIRYKDQDVTKYEEKLPKTKEEFQCNIEGWTYENYRNMRVSWYIGDQQIGEPLKKGRGLNFDDSTGKNVIKAKLNYELKEEHYSQKLKCKADSEGLNLEQEVTLLMKSKF